MQISRPGGEVATAALTMLRTAQRTPARRAFCRLVGNGEVVDSSPAPQWYTWGQIAQWVMEACSAIDKWRLPTGSHLATVERNSAEWFVLDFACQILGLVHVAIDHRWPDAMVVRLLEQSDASLLFSRSSISTPSVRDAALEWSVNWHATAIRSAALAELIERARVVTPDSPAQMLFTSGTSGEPKGVVLSHRNLVSNALAKLDAAPQFESDLRLNILPFCHAYARTCELTTWVFSSSRLAIAHNWSDFLRQAKQLSPSLVNLVPHLANQLFHPEKTEWAGGTEVQRLAPHDVVERLGGRVRLLQVGGAALPDALWHELAGCGLPPLQGYGLTEASPVVCSNRAGEQQPGSIGSAVAGVELRVDASGQLWVRGENVMVGYYADALATQSRIQDGWLATGDLVEQDRLGHYRVLGRTSAVIVLSSGFKVSPELIEGRLAGEPWIERVLVAGQDRPYIVAVVWPAWSSLPGRFFCDAARDHPSVKHELLREELARVTLQRLEDLPGFMRPKKIIVVTRPIDADATAGLLNSKGVLRRNQANLHFQEQIAAAYAQPWFQYPSSPNEYPSNQ